MEARLWLPRSKTYCILCVVPRNPAEIITGPSFAFERWP